MARPCTCDKFSPNPDAKAGDRGCNWCWLYNHRSHYREYWDRPQKNTTANPPARPRLVEPVGDYLAMFFRWLGQVKAKSCGCATLQQKLNRHGVAGCRKHYDFILSKLQEAAFARNLPITRERFKPVLSAAIWLAWLHGWFHKLTSRLAKQHAK